MTFDSTHPVISTSTPSHRPAKTEFKIGHSRSWQSGLSINRAYNLNDAAMPAVVVDGFSRVGAWLDQHEKLSLCTECLARMSLPAGWFHEADLQAFVACFWNSSVPGIQRVVLDTSPLPLHTSS